MSEENIPDLPSIVQSSLIIKDFEFDLLKRSNRTETMKHGLIGFLNLIPVVGGALAAWAETGLSQVDRRFLEKFFEYLYQLKDTTYEEREKFLLEVENKANDYAGAVLCDIVYSLDNINKSVIIANLTKAKINEFISIEDFFRLTSIVERVPYTDYNDLIKFTVPNYVNGGVTEILYSAGALIQQSIGPDEINKFILSINGRKLLRFGFNVDISLDIENRTEVDGGVKWRTIDAGTF